jgi:hypothetical protein
MLSRSRSSEFAFLDSEKNCMYVHSMAPKYFKYFFHI